MGIPAFVVVYPFVDAIWISFHDKMAGAPARYNEVITNTNGRFVPVYPDLFNDPWWTSRPEFKEFIKIAETGVPVSYKGPPTAASGEILATHVIPEALQTVLLENVPAEAAVAKVAGKIKAIYDRLEG